MMVLFHGFMGVRTIVTDYVHRPRVRAASLTALFLLGLLLFVAGTNVVMTLPTPGAR
jgi:succinate dehydrogenase hydrophobic anchor subunit